MLKVFGKKIVGTIVVSILFGLMGTGTSSAMIDPERHNYDDRMLSRGEAVYLIVDSFRLLEHKRNFLNECTERPDECFFVFAAMSDFDDIAFSPLTLYPDVHEKYRYYQAINTASMLGLIHGYLDEASTPFRPEIVMTRIQALKVVLGAGELIDWKERFELSDEESGQSTAYVDKAFEDADKWWYSRYVNVALDYEIVTVDSPDSLFRPDDVITFAELSKLIENTLEYSSSSVDDSQIHTSGDSA